MSLLDKAHDVDQKRLKARQSIRDRWAALPGYWRVLAILAFIVVLYTLPYMYVPGLNYIRTDVGTAGGSDWSSTLFTCAVYVLIAVGLNIVIGLAGLLDLGYIGFYAIGAYSVALFGSPDSSVVKWFQGQFDLPETWAVAWAVCIPIAVALTMISGVILGAPTLRLRGDYLAIVTLGFGEIIRLIALNSTFTGGPQGVTQVPAPPGEYADGTRIFNVGDAAPFYWIALSVTILCILGVRRLEHSRVGRAWLAVREDEDAAAVMGVNGFKFKLWAFAMGAALGGVSGALFASRQGYIDPTNFLLNLSIIFVAMVVVGGSGNMAGVAVGAVLVVYLQEKFRVFADWRPLAVGLALVAVMILRPQGLIPSRRRSRELQDRQEEAPANV